MKLTIKLKNKRYCDDCPCWEYNDFEDCCEMGYWNEATKKTYYNHLIRPKKCITENGK